MTGPAPYYRDEHVELHHGAAVEVLRGLPDASVGCIFTSPPYYGLRAYGDDPREQGTEPTVPEFIDGLLAVFREARRVLADDGTLWVNLGDTYSSKANARNTDAGREAKGHSRKLGMLQGQRNTTGVAPYKSLLMVPERLALAMTDDGWVLRNRITWVKTNGTPEPVADRFTARSEAMWFFTKKSRYWFDLDAVRDAGSNPGDSWLVDEEDPAASMPEVWRIPNRPFPAAHFAVMNPDVARRALRAGCKPGATVLDPYSGAGTTGMVAAELGRPYIGIELYKQYLDLSLRTRLAQSALMFGEGA